METKLWNLRRVLCALALSVALLASVRVLAEPLTEKEGRQLELAVKAQTVLFQLEHRIENRIELDEALSDSELTALFQGASDKILQVYVPKLTRPSLSQRARALLAAANWKNAVEQAKNLSHLAKTFGQRHGLAMGSAVVVGTFLEIAIPVVLLKVGLPILIPLNIVTPWEPIIFGAVHGLQQTIADRKLGKLYGDPKAYRAMKADRAELRKLFNLRAVGDILVPLITRGTVAVVSEKPGMLARALQLVGLKGKHLTWKNLLAFSKTHRVSEGLLNALDESRQLTSEIKAAILLGHLARFEDPALILDLRKTYAASFHPIKSAGSEEAVLWATRFAEVKTAEEAHALFQEVPAGVSPKIVASLWSEVILPTLSTYFEDRKEVHRLQHEFLPLLAEADKSTEAEWTPEWTGKFDSYFAGPPVKPACPVARLARPAPQP